MSEGPSEIGWLRGILVLAWWAVLLVPAIAMVLAWDAGRRKPRVSRTCARVGIVGAVIAALVCVGTGALLFADREMGAPWFFLIAGPLIGVFQAGVFAFSWMLARDARRRLDSARTVTEE